MRPRRRYQVRDTEGRELTVPSLADLHDLYDQGFLGDDDLVKQEQAADWERAGSMPALAGSRHRKGGARWVVTVLAAAVMLAAAIGLLLGRR